MRRAQVIRRRGLVVRFFVRFGRFGRFKPLSKSQRRKAMADSKDFALPPTWTHLKTIRVDSGLDCGFSGKLEGAIGLLWFCKSDCYRKHPHFFLESDL